MKKRTVGIVAGVLGVSLLAGGTTLALWSDQEDLNGGTIATGNLDVSATGTGAWYDLSPNQQDGWVAAEDSILLAPLVSTNDPLTAIPGTFKIVPGDLLEFSQQINVIATGDNIEAQVTADVDALTASLDPALQGFVVFGIAVFDGTTLLSATDEQTTTFSVPNTNAAASKTYTVKFRLGFDGATEDRDGALNSIDLTEIPIVLEQVRPPVIP